jgi:hypothetical protein
MRRQHPSLAGESAQLEHQRFGRPMRAATRILFIGGDDIADEPLDLRGNRIDFGGGQMGHEKGSPERSWIWLCGVNELTV